MEHGAIRGVRSQAIPEFRYAAGLRAVGASSTFVLSISDTTSIYRDVGVAPTTLSLPGGL
ncbi:tRNA(Ile)-lysidine synthase (fragment) [Methylotuvimicrobium alcaliphilum 20Z]|uniref:tRNA(Ile)-lysidine synthase n=1 Tax=Methylotuvimicrobium alcaliphilum (strain DSM 19304 / NCIMB 14124 / VKM B-2133 / 20Z) TaxID=1091494 RepID=G4T3W5_META2